MFDFIALTDGYKLDHRRQYPAGTEFIYSNFTARGSRVPGQKTTVFFGLQYFLRQYLTYLAQDTFFTRPRQVVLDDYRRLVDDYLGPNDIGTDHIKALHEYGRIPLRFNAVPEGTRVPLRMPMFTFENTHKDFFWMTNYIETMLSSVLWLPCTSATTADRYRIALERAAELSGGPRDFVPWQGHDFSFRGLENPEAAALSGAAHLLSFTGTDSLPAITLLRKFYSAPGARGQIGGSVPATEHAVMCAGGQDDEKKTFERLMDLYPSGIVSVVSDTWDFWNVIGTILPQLKARILQREGKLVIRPDSGDPEKILCGDRDAAAGTLPAKGLIRCLWDIFGGTTNAKGFRELDSHIGAIYGDSITEERCKDICANLMAQGYASTNVVFGIGSYTYQHVTRDTYGVAIKATWAQINGEEHMMCKTPKTDDGVKNSARGRIALVNEGTGLKMIDGLNKRDEEIMTQRGENLLQPVWSEGRTLRPTSVSEIRYRLKTS